MKLIPSLLSFGILIAVIAPGDDHNRDLRHEGLTEAQLGTVHFPISCEESVKKSFERGVALLHSFWYEESERQFVQVANLDQHCAMAYWGIAMSLWHQLWEEPDAKVISRGMKESLKAKALQDSLTPREHAYIEAISLFYEHSDELDHKARANAYSDAMKKIYESYPDDHEAAAFYALSLLAWDEGLQSRKQAAAILEKVFAVEPDHPGIAHYLIHSYDTPELAQLGIPAARRYAQIAPAAPHALHMPSHIFARVGLWQDDVNSNLQSVAATRKTVAMGRGGEEHQFHALDFLVYAYLQSGQESEAQKIAEGVKAMPASPNMYGMQFDPRLVAETRFDSSIALELHNWEIAASLPPLSDTDQSYNAVIYLARALGAARSGKISESRKDVEQIKSIASGLREKQRAGEADFLDRQVAGPLAWIAHSEGKDDEAINLLRPLADKEIEGFSQAGYLPAHELLADLLLESQRPDQALIEYQADLKLNPNRFNGLYGAARAAEAVGKPNEANQYYAALLKSCAGSTSTRPELSRAREALAKKKDQSGEVH